ncbi:MAG: hypothetical protein ACOY0T_14135 [Myxococcota bacterium]
MKQLSRLAAVVGACSFAVFTGCGGGEESGPGTGTSNIMEPVTLCNEVVKTECARIYECTTPTARQLAMLPATEQDCVSELSAYLKCSDATATKVCTGEMAYTLKQGNSCIDQAKAASCQQINNNGTNIAAYAPACGQCAPL